MRIQESWNASNSVFFIGTLACAMVALPLEFRHSLHHWSEWVLFLVLVNAVSMGITAGYHRLLSHRAYRASAPVRFLLLCLGAAAFQNSALNWASDHRIHHRHVDGDQDPYAITKGFWYAHWLWILKKQDQPPVGVDDLQQDPLVRWQHRHPFLIGGVVSLAAPLAVGLATHNVAGHLIIGVLLRIVVNHHVTFLINSAAHVFGRRPYTEANSARDNTLLALLTNGEGYHNYHHMWQWDYRNGVRWYHLDSTKWFLAVLAWAGLVRGLRRVPDAVIRKAELAMEARRLEAALAQAPGGAAAGLELRIGQARLRLEQALEALHQHQLTREAIREAWTAHRAEWRRSLAQRRAELRAAWAEWRAARSAVRRLALVRA